MIFELTVLGSSSALPTSSKFPTAHALNVHERFFLIDCGEGAQMQIRKANLKFSKLNNIFISHIHGDHVFGLFGVLSTFNLLGRRYALNIYGPSGLKTMLDFFIENFADDFSYEINFHPLIERKNQQVYEDKLIEVIAFPLKHRVPTYGYLFREKRRPLNIKKAMVAKLKLSIKQINAVKEGGDLVLEDGSVIKNTDLTEAPYHCRSYAYVSDTSIYKKNAQLLKGVDLLYHEATFMHADKKLAKTTGHSTARQAAEMASLSEAKQLLIGHFSNRYKYRMELLNEAREVFPNTIIAEELQKYSIPLVRNNISDDDRVF